METNKGKNPVNRRLHRTDGSGDSATSHYPSTERTKTLIHGHFGKLRNHSLFTLNDEINRNYSPYKGKKYRELIPVNNKLNAYEYELPKMQH